MLEEDRYGLTFEAGTVTLTNAQISHYDPYLQEEVDDNFRAVSTTIGVYRGKDRQRYICRP